MISCLDRRQAKHPVATFLLQVLSAIEATHSIRTQGAFLRTYHNTTADALTREDARRVMLASGLTPLEGAAEALQIYLERGWTRRALLWAGQADADRGQALRLHVRTKIPFDNSPRSLRRVQTTAGFERAGDWGERSQIRPGVSHERRKVLWFGGRPGRS